MRLRPSKESTAEDAENTEKTGEGRSKTGRVRVVNRVMAACCDSVMTSSPLPPSSSAFSAFSAVYLLLSPERDRSRSVEGAQGIAGGCRVTGRHGRKVGSPQGRRLGNAQSARAGGTCNREKNARTPKISGRFPTTRRLRACRSKPPGRGPARKRGGNSSVRLKGCGKSAPAASVTRSARQTPSGARPYRTRTARPQRSGRLLEPAGNGRPRGMISSPNGGNSAGDNNRRRSPLPPSPSPALSNCS